LEKVYFSPENEFKRVLKGPSLKKKTVAMVSGGLGSCQRLWGNGC